MSNIEWLLEMLDRAYNGPLCSADDWDLEIIPTKVAERLAAHRLNKTFDRDNPVNQDDSLADEFYQAGLELALETGLYCIDTERIIKLSEEEIAEAIASQPAEVTLGAGSDQIVRRARRPEDGQPPIFTALVGTPLSEDIYVDVTTAMAAIPEIDALSGCTLYTVLGRPILGGTPYETMAGRLEVTLKKEAVRRAGRPGLALSATQTSPTAYGFLASFGMSGGHDPASDLPFALGPAELKTAFEVFHKVVHAHQCQAILRSASPSMIGGYAGGPEGAVLANIAVTIFQRAVYRTSIGGGETFDVRYLGNCGRQGIWALSVLNQALSRNSHFLADPLAEQVAGPNTEMLMWESAVGMLTIGASGASGSIGPRSSGGARLDYITPLETKFCAELLKAGAKMTRSQVNQIARELIPRYEEHLFHPPTGQTIQECYDLQTMEPHDDYLALYTRVKKELTEMGVPF